MFRSLPSLAFSDAVDSFLLVVPERISGEHLLRLDRIQKKKALQLDIEFRGVPHCCPADCATMALILAVAFRSICFAFETDCAVRDERKSSLLLSGGRGDAAKALVPDALLWLCLCVDGAARWRERGSDELSQFTPPRPINFFLRLFTKERW